MTPDTHAKKSSDPECLRHGSRLGLRVAAQLFAMAVSASTIGSLQGCLITEDLQFEGQVDVPPALAFRPRSEPMVGDTLRVDTDALEAMNVTELRFRLYVRDENVEQDLETQIRLRTLVSNSEVNIRDAEPGELVGTGESVREFEFSLLTAELRDGHCHQLQLAVSGAFIDRDDLDRIFALPVTDGDVMIATWWLWETSAPLDPETCPTDEF